MNRVQKIFMDQTIYLTVKCSIYICAVGLLAGDDFDTCKQTVKDKIGGIVVTAWKFWPLVHCITYGVIPARHRILWVNSVDLIWNAILATQAQKGGPDDATIDETDATPTLLEAAPLEATVLVEETTLAEHSVTEQHVESVVEAEEAVPIGPAFDIANDVDGVLIGAEETENRASGNKVSP